ncbi:hypothetical protein FACS18942_05460 [Planctomycetales bacterium]|nr:hypothetical protein FACS18942_05460 [Planctomycetales bacterium]GHT38648.1 hypothetical protein FACS189427_12890 [Planctomycetales bacterium]
MIKLFDPPFDTSALNPGYIKGYVPSMSIDRQIQEQLVIPLVDDRFEHWIEAKIL